MGRSEPESQPITWRPQGPMRQLSPEERRRWQSATLASPGVATGLTPGCCSSWRICSSARPRTRPRFRARELIARTPYQSWAQAAYLKGDQRGTGWSRQIGCDEGVHKEISLARIIIPAART